MATTEAERPDLPLVRRLEAAGFRAWPAARVSFDGSWQLRMTPGHPSKRLNCLVPLDPFDERDMEMRVRSAERAFAAHGLRVALRQSPLCPAGLPAVLEGLGWHRGHETLVMTAALDTLDLAGGMDHLPTHDIQRFSEACVRIDRAREVMRHPRVKITDFEARAGTRYTAETLRRLMGACPGVRFVWIMGADNLAQFHRWQDWRWIMENVPVGVLARPGQRIAAQHAKAADIFVHARLRGRESRLLARGEAPRWCFVNVPMVDVSSTEIRARGGWG